MKSRWIGLFVTLIVVLSGFYYGGNEDLHSIVGFVIKESDRGELLDEVPEVEGMVVGSFNIQIFGQSKIDIIPELSEILKQFDVVGIQEIRDKSGEAIELLAEEMNYSYVVSERLGKSVSKEQYAFLYNSNLKVGRTYQYISEDFERPPFLAEFFYEDLSFILINIHTKPDHAEEEIFALVEVIEFAKEEFNNEDVILIGDLNADGSYFNEEQRFEGNWMIPTWADTTVASSDNTYDNLIYSDSLTDNFVVAGIDKDITKNISDHYPIWGVFSE